MSQQRDTLTVGTRGSLLARTQTDTIVRVIRRRFPHLDVSVTVVSTEGDRVQDVAISRLGDKGVFVRNIEGALLEGRIDLAVHSLKDVPSEADVPGLMLAAFTAREDARDALISRDGSMLRELAPGAVVGTGSLRRRSQLAACRPDLRTKDIRGNVDTRLRKLEDGEYDAVILAAAGLLRLGMSEVITEYLPVQLFTPDAGQGILAVQMRVDDWLQEVAAEIDDRSSRLAAEAERTCVRTLGADCRSPVGAYATVEGDIMVVSGMAAREDGSQLHRDYVRGPASESRQLGRELGSRLLAAFTPSRSDESGSYTGP